MTDDRRQHGDKGTGRDGNAAKKTEVKSYSILNAFLLAPGSFLLNPQSEIVKFLVLSGTDLQNQLNYADILSG